MFLDEVHARYALRSKDQVPFWDTMVDEIATAIDITTQNTYSVVVRILPLPEFLEVLVAPSDTSRVLCTIKFTYEIEEGKVHLVLVTDDEQRISLKGLLWEDLMCFFIKHYFTDLNIRRNDVERWHLLQPQIDKIISECNLT